MAIADRYLSTLTLLANFKNCHLLAGAEYGEIPHLEIEIDPIAKRHRRYAPLADPYASKAGL